MSRVLVTGGGGFIGSHLTDALLNDGHDVRVVDNFSTGFRDNLDDALPRIELIEGDLVDAAVAREACTGVDTVFHLAALGSVPRSVEDPMPSHRANIDATFNVLLAASEAGARRVVYAASSSAYGDVDAPAKDEGISPRPLSPYAVQKLTGEFYASAFSGCYGLETISLRYFNVFGPRQSPKSQYAAAIPAFIAAVLEGRRPTVYGDGEQTRDFTYIANVVHANLLAMRLPSTRGEVVNIAGGNQISVNEVLRRLGELMGSDVEPNYVDPRPGDVLHSRADISRARSLIGFEPTVGFPEGLARTLAYLQSREGASAP